MPLTVAGRAGKERMVAALFRKPKNLTFCASCPGNTIPLYMKAIFSFLLLIPLLSGCSESHEAKKARLTGTWGIVETPGEEYYDLMNGDGPFGLTIYKDSIEFLNGFVRVIKSSANSKYQFEYTNNLFPYRLQADSIFIADSSTISPFKWKIEKLLADTLKLADGDGRRIKMHRIIFRQYDSPDFDQIIFSRSGCYGPCPIYDLSIKTNGHLLYRGINFVSDIGIYSDSLDPAQTRDILSKFKRVDIANIPASYSAGYTDGETVSTTYLKDGKILKTISDYGREGPKELVWAYTAMEYLRPALEPEGADSSFLPGLKFNFFEKDSTRLRLEDSESFLLWNQLRQSSVVNKEFTPEYLVSYGQWHKDKPIEIAQIDSDGRYFRFQIQGQQPITYDLGYDFIDRHFGRGFWD